jgi:SAM-dependent methyltransferase
MKCPICDSSDFREFRGRPSSFCGGCSATERARYVWMYIEKMRLVSRHRTVFHFGPERGIGNRIFDVVGPLNYYPLDLFPEVYSNHEHPPIKFDILADLPNEPDSSVDVIIANHILEHLPCPVEWVVSEFNRVLRQGGDLIITVPITSNPKTLEDLSEDLPVEERIRRFGQKDHYRTFGWNEFPEMMKKVLARDSKVHRTKIFTEAEMLEAAIPYAEDRPDSNTIFHYRKMPRRSTALGDRQ